MKKVLYSLIALILLVSINLAFWSLVNHPVYSPSWQGEMMGVSFNPLRADQSPFKGDTPSAEQIDSDLALLQDKVHAVRIYSVGGGMDKVLELAAKYDLNVTVGAWIDKDMEKNRAEVDKLIQLSRDNHRNIVRTLVGNEALLRKDVTVDELIGYIRQVKQQTWRPVSTAETWDIWLAHPELVEEVDFIGVHILPYWEGIDIRYAVDFVFDRYQALQTAYPDKPIVITEVGWPSNGKPFKQSTASITHQADFLRQFLKRATQENLIYYVVEAFDQPWKMTVEGSSGAYWGIFDAHRQPKFPMEGNIFSMPDWKVWAYGSCFFSLVLILIFYLARRKQIHLLGKFYYGLICNILASTIVWTAAIGYNQYHTNLSIVLWITLLALQVLSLVVLLVESVEAVEILWSNYRRRQFKPLTVPEGYRFPKVSLHLPIHNEPPTMVKRTLNALQALDYPNLEVLVIDNNTKDDEVWQPIREHCELLGQRFRFFHLENWPGYKAGALNFALKKTAADAEIIAVIDSDYIVRPDWLKQLIPYFSKQDVAFVQAPQNYYDWQDNIFKTFCHWEYAGFFHLGMVQRNESNAIIQHGTMTLVRKAALQQVGEWGEWCICEDSELGVRLYRAGYDSVYVCESFGEGVTPDTLSGYTNQRFRWVYGGMQILKRHWRGFLSMKKSDLTTAQRYYFLAGWLPWFSDAFALLFTTAALLLTASVILNPIQAELPVIEFVFPTIGLFCFKVSRSLLLYKARVPCTIMQALGASLAGLALTYTVGKAVLQGLFTSGRPFLRTPKYESSKPFLAGLSTIREELFMFFLLMVAMVSFINVDQFDNMSGKLWLGVLMIQTVPYCSSFLLFLINCCGQVRQPAVEPAETGCANNVLPSP